MSISTTAFTTPKWRPNTLSSTANFPIHEAACIYDFDSGRRYSNTPHQEHIRSISITSFASSSTDSGHISFTDETGLDTAVVDFAYAKKERKPSIVERVRRRSWDWVARTGKGIGRRLSGRRGKVAKGKLRAEEEDGERLRWGKEDSVLVMNGGADALGDDEVLVVPVTEGKEEVMRR